jgi:hypothetical protein
MTGRTTKWLSVRGRSDHAASIGLEHAKAIGSHGRAWALSHAQVIGSYVGVQAPSRAGSRMGRSGTRVIGSID